MVLSENSIRVQCDCFLFSIKFNPFAPSCCSWCQFLVLGLESNSMKLCSKTSVWCNPLIRLHRKAVYRSFSYERMQTMKIAFFCPANHFQINTKWKCNLDFLISIILLLSIELVSNWMNLLYFLLNHEKEWHILCHIQFTNINMLSLQEFLSGSI